MSIVNYCVPTSEAHLKAFETAQHKNQKLLIKETMAVRNEHNLSTKKITWTFVLRVRKSHATPSTM